MPATIRPEIESLFTIQFKLDGTVVGYSPPSDARTLLLHQRVEAQCVELGWRSGYPNEIAEQINWYRARLDYMKTYRTFPNSLTQWKWAQDVRRALKYSQEQKQKVVEMAMAILVKVDEEEALSNGNL